MDDLAQEWEQGMALGMLAARYGETAADNPCTERTERWKGWDAGWHAVMGRTTPKN